MSKNQERNIKDMAERMERRSAVTREEEKRVSGTKNADEASRKESARVASPYGHGVDVVKRVIDMIEAMHKRGQLNGQQFMAAQTYRSAYEITYGQAGGAMDFSRVRGASLPGSPPMDAALRAGQICRFVDHTPLLGFYDRMVVKGICVQGLSLTELAAQCKNPGDRLREGLTLLGQHWHPEAEGKGSKIRSHSQEAALSPEAKREAIRAAQEGEIGPVRAVHATSHKVYQKRS